MSIPVKNIVSVIAGSLATGGNPLSSNGLILTTDPAVPMGSVLSFGSATAVGEFFGPAADETAAAQTYFLGFSGATALPSQLHFAQYPIAAVPAYLRGGSLESMTLTELQSLSGVLTISVDGTPVTTTAIDLSTATSFTNAATIIDAAIPVGSTATASWDALRYAFVITSGTTGAASSISYATGTLSTGIKLTAETGAVISLGSAVGDPAVTMPAIKAINENWVSFTTLFEATIPEMTGFAEWANGEGARFLYVSWDADVNAIAPNDSLSFGSLAKAAAYDAVYPVYAPINGYTAAVFVLAVIASLDWAQTNGRATLAFRNQPGLIGDVTDETQSNNLQGNGYNYVGSFASANDAFTFMYPGQVSGRFLWADSYVNQIRLNSQLQLALIGLLLAIKSIPYSNAGKALQMQAMLGPINEALNFGTIRTGVLLSPTQRAIVNQEAGGDIASQLETTGYFLQILDATAQARQNRESMPANLWYMDGGSVQRIELSSIAVL